MEKKKSNKGLVVALIIIIVLLLGGLGFGAYKYMSLDKDYSKLKNENKSISEDLNKQKEEAEKAKSEQEKVSTTNDYSLFVKKMKEERAKLNTTANGWKYVVSFPAEGDANDYHPAYKVNLTIDGILSVNKKTIAKDVLFYRILYFGNGGFKGIYYVSEDGKAYFSDIEYALYQKREFKTKVIKNASNVVNILPAFVDEFKDGFQGPGGSVVYFVDINGNIYSAN